MDFGEAIEAMKNGKRVGRSGWNGKNQYIELASKISYVNPDGVVVNADHSAIGNQAVAFVGTSGVQLGWLASQADMLADDWELKEEKPTPTAAADSLLYLALMMMFFSLDQLKKE